MSNKNKFQRNLAIEDTDPERPQKFVIELKDHGKVELDEY